MLFGGLFLNEKQIFILILLIASFIGFVIFVNAVVKTRSIPFEIKAGRTETPSAFDLFLQQRKAAEASEKPELTLDEINAEIQAARDERRKRQTSL